MSKAEEFLERSLEGVIPHLEARRFHYRRHALFGYIGEGVVGLASLCLTLVGGFLGEDVPLFIGLLGLLVLTPLFILSAISAQARYKAFFVSEVTPLCSSGLYQSFRTDTTKDFDPLRAEVGGGLEKKLLPRAASYFEGKYRDVSFWTFVYHAKEKVKKGAKEVVGRLYSFSLNASLGTDILIKNKLNAQLFASVRLPLVIKTDSTLFEDTHAVTAADEEKARAFLTPVLLTTLMDLEADYQGHLAAYFHDQKLTLYLDDCGIPFTLSVFRPITFEFLQSYVAEVVLGSRLIKAFGLR